MIEILFAVVLAVLGALLVAFSFSMSKMTKVPYIPNRWQYLPNFALSIQVLISILTNIYISGIWFMLPIVGSLVFTLVVSEVCHKKRTKLIKAHYPEIGDGDEN